VIEVCKYLEEHGFRITYLPVDEFGMVSVSAVEAAITTQTVLITIMHANNEVGTIQPIKQISKLAEKHGIILHTDAAQSVGKILTDVDELGVQLLSIAGHKVYAPKGIGALYIREGLQLNRLFYGAGQERGRRAGTENVLEIIGLGKACDIAHRDLKQNILHMKKLRDRLHNGLKEKLKQIKLNGHPEERLPNTLSMSFRNAEANVLLSKIQDYVAASAGAACHSDRVEISSVLNALRIPEEWAKGTLRFSTGRMTTEEDIDTAVKIISDAVLQHPTRELARS